MFDETGHEQRSEGAFDRLGPREVLSAVEGVSDRRCDGFVQPYASYVNRVYALRDEDGEYTIAKFYRPGRWSLEMIQEEHSFLEELVREEVPVVAPLRDAEGDTLFELELQFSEGEDADGSVVVPFALFPRRGGRGFDADSDDDWSRLGSIVGRIHACGRRGRSDHRPRLDAGWGRRYLDRIVAEGVIHPEIRDEFDEVCSSGLDSVVDRFSGVELHRIHGDCHRGNILDRPGEGLLVIDFDDMMMGPAVQDLWLLLPDRAEQSRRELTMILDGYETFVPFDRHQLALIEPLRLMRMIHFLAWRAEQRHDDWFRRQEPEWGNRAFWVRELEDIRDQVRAIHAGSVGLE